MFWRSGSVMTGEGENGPPLTNETKRPRRWMKVILTLALSGALGGFLISYMLPTRYQTQATILVESPKIPEEYVHSIITSDIAERVQSLEEEVKSPSHLHPMLQSLGYVRPEEQSSLTRDIQQNMQVDPVITSMSAAAEPAKAAGFTVTYTDTDAARAQKICNAVTSLIVDANLRSRSEVAQSTTDFLNRQVDDAKRALDDQDAKLAAFKKQYMGQLPSGADNNGRMSANPIIEEQYKLLTRDNDTSLAFYKELLAKRNSAALSTSMENQQMGEQMHIAASADLPEDPVFPDRWLLTLWGLGIGLLLGIGRLLWPAARKLFQRFGLVFPAET